MRIAGGWRAIMPRSGGGPGGVRRWSPAPLRLRFALLLGGRPPYRGRLSWGEDYAGAAAGSVGGQVDHSHHRAGHRAPVAAIPRGLRYGLAGPVPWLPSPRGTMTSGTTLPVDRGARGRGAPPHPIVLSRWAAAVCYQLRAFVFAGFWTSCWRAYREARKDSRFRSGRAACAKCR